MPVRKERTRYQFNPDFARLFVDSATETAERFLRFQAERLTRNLKDAILGQQYNWYPLDPVYLAKKVKDGFDPRILIRTKEYVENIQVFQDTAPHGVLFRVDVPDRDHNSDLPFSELARIMEFGRRDGKKPYARPHWRPTWSIFVRDLPTVKRTLGQTILDDLRQRLTHA